MNSTQFDHARLGLDYRKRDVSPCQSESIHSDEGLTLETSVFESFTVANLPYRPRG